MSLATWKYRNVVDSVKGPIKALYSKEINSALLGKYHEVNVFLSDELCIDNSKGKGLYSRGGGGGSDVSKTRAMHKAISEALERWAFYEHHNSKKSTLYGFNLTCNTTGMAAYPTFLFNHARSIALLEARERFAVCAWWEKKLSHELFDVTHMDKTLNVIQIISPWKDTTIVISWTPLKAHPDKVAYAFAAHGNHEHALKKSIVELERNITLLDSYFSNPDRLSPNEMDFDSEIRLLYFASEDGHKSFEERVNQQVKTLAILEPKLVIDVGVNGPWNKYTSVWRCLYENNTLSSDEFKQDYFLF